MSYKSSSFYLDDDNIAYIDEQIKGKKRYNKSNWLNDLVDHLRAKGGAVNNKYKAERSKPKVYPKNLDEQFEILWETKGKVGAKNGAKGAYNKFKKLAEGASEEGCETFTQMLMDDILKHQHEPGYPEMHLTTYLNQERWIR